MSYGDVAEFVGAGSARAVGMVMSRHGSEVPWHRVLHSDGTCATHKSDRQLDLLRGEGVPVIRERVAGRGPGGDGGETGRKESFRRCRSGPATRQPAANCPG